MIRLLTAGILMMGCLIVSSERALPGETETNGQLVWESWNIPADVVSTGDPSTLKPKAGFAIKQDSDRWDASEFVKSLGAENIPGAEASYDIVGETLIVKNTKKAVAEIGSVLSYAGLENAPAHIVAELSVYEYIPIPSPKNGFAVWPNFADLTNNNSRLVERIAGTTKSGLRSQYLRRTSTDEKSAKPKSDTLTESFLGKEGLGIEVLLECVMACEHYIDSHLDFRWRGKLPDNTTASLSFTTQFNTVESQPIVVQVSSRENSPGKYLVVTANFRPESSPVWTLESLSKIAEKTREIRMSIKSASPP